MCDSPYSPLHLFFIRSLIMAIEKNLGRQCLNYRRIHSANARGRLSLEVLDPYLILSNPTRTQPFLKNIRVPHQHTSPCAFFDASSTSPPLLASPQQSTRPS